MSTIAAISSPIGAGGIGILRVSGEDALKIADTVFIFSSKNKPNYWEPLKLNFGTFAADGFADNGYAVYFPPEKAFTGEATVEFYLHGGVRIMSGALETLLSRGARLAEKGEFTKRAYLAGRLSLADAEGVIDMINAESAAGLRAAFRLMEGELSTKTNALSSRLLDLMTAAEAALDYPEETEDEVIPEIGKVVPELSEEIRRLINSARAGKMAKHGITAVLAGDTNAGKSSLMNALLKENRAIVTPVAGTTRDTIEASFECDGVKINLVDTAGIRESSDEIEREGINRAKAAIEGADVVIHVIDTTGPSRREIDFGEKLTFTVFNKCDQTSFRCPRIANAYAVSAKTGENVDMLARGIAAVFKNGEIEGGEIITNERHLSALYRAQRAFEHAMENPEATVDCLLIDLREAYDALGEITGRTATEDIVNGVFEKFCVGK